MLTETQQEQIRQVMDHDGKPCDCGVSPNDLFYCLQALVRKTDMVIGQYLLDRGWRKTAMGGCWVAPNPNPDPNDYDDVWFTSSATIAFQHQLDLDRTG